MSAGESEEPRESRLLGAAVEVDDAAVLGHLVGILFEILCNSIADSAAGGVIHSAAGCVARIGICPHDKERTAYGGNEGIKRIANIKFTNAGEAKASAAQLRRNNSRCRGSRRQSKCLQGRRSESAEADLDEGGNEAECGVCLSKLRSVLGMTPVPAGVGMAGEDDGVILAVLREQLAIGVLRSLPA